MLKMLNSLYGIDLYADEVRRRKKQLDMFVRKIQAIDNHCQQSGALLELYPYLPYSENINKHSYNSAFLWSWLDITERLSVQEVIKQKYLMNHLGYSLFDNFFTNLPIGAKIVAKNEPDKEIIFPRMGIKIKIIDRDFQVTKINSYEIIVSGDSSNNKYHISLIDTKHHKFNAFKIDPKLCRNLVACMDTEKSFLDYKGSDCAFSKKIANCLSLIRVAHSDFYQEIVSNIYYYVPLDSDWNDRRSFTLNYYPDITFISYHEREAGRDSDLSVAEDIIHEYHHTELNTLTNFFDIYKPILTMYYSPLRLDPRPILPFIHAIYVLIAIVEFYFGALNSNNFSSKDEAMLSQVINRRLYQLDISLHQITHDKLTDNGVLLINALRAKLKHMFLEARSLFGRRPMPQHVLDHLRNWKKTNTNEFSKITLPDYLNSHV